MAPQRRFTPEAEAEICRSYRDGDDPREIMRDCRIASGTFYNILRRNGTPTVVRRAKLADAEILGAMKERYGKGESIAKLAGDYGLSCHLVKSHLEWLGVPLRIRKSREARRLSTDATSLEPWAIEEWRPINGWPHYEVSDIGRVRTYKRPFSTRIEPDPIILDCGIDDHGYVCVLLSSRDPKKQEKISVHTLVLRAFVGTPPMGMQGLHRDGNPLNNRLDNLYWGTPLENSLDAIKHGRKGLLKVSDIPVIWERLLANESPACIARDFGVGPDTIRSIRSGRNWTHITRTLPGWPLVDRSLAKRKPVYPEKKYRESKEEIWGSPPGFSAYRVSNRGRFQHCRHRHGRGWIIDPSRWNDLTGCLNKHGYIQCCVRNDAGEKKHPVLHDLILLAFAGPCPPGMMGCHRDGNRLNNDAGNLKWDTPSGNSNDTVEHARRDGRNIHRRPTIDVSLETLLVQREQLGSWAAVAKAYGITLDWLLILRKRLAA